jgi:hypothetical protein
VTLKQRHNKLSEAFWGIFGAGKDRRRRWVDERRYKKM